MFGRPMRKVIYIQKEIEPEMILNLSEFQGNEFGSRHNSKCFLMISFEEGMCNIVAEFQPNNNLQGYGQYAIRVHNDKLQYFNNQNGWSYFDDSAQNEFQLKRADDILLGDSDEVQNEQDA